MTYFTADEIQAATERWDAEVPDWDERSCHPEARRFVAEQDVADAHQGFVRRYGNDDPGRYYPGVNGE